MSTLTLFADDLATADRWYTELLGVAPYFRSEDVGRGHGYVEFRIGDHQHELGLIDRRYAPDGVATRAGGPICYWHVDDLRGELARWLERGATLVEDVTERGPGFVTASVLDPFGNLVGLMWNRHYLAMLECRRAAS